MSVTLGQVAYEAYVRAAALAVQKGVTRCQRP
jgi:hypothetical protein